MKLLVLSDSHGRQQYMAQAMALEAPDAVIHLGDYETDAQTLMARWPQLPLYQVCGNCDRGASAPGQLLELEGVRLFLTHGHLYQVKYGLLRAELAAREAQADVLLFGHTHRAYCEKKDGLYLLNPGSCGGRGPAGYGVVTLANGRAACRLEALPG